MSDSDATADQHHPTRRHRRAVLLAALSGLVAVLCGLALPFAPVSVSEPTVHWPADPADPESTLLTVTRYHPLGMDVRFSCAVARAAAATSDRVVLSTALPGNPESSEIGLLVTVTEGRVEVGARDRVLFDEPLPAGRCTYRITGRSAGLPSYLAQSDQPPADPQAFAGPRNAELVISRDGRELVRTPSEQLPGVDVLASSLRDLPAGLAGELAVELRVDDEFTSRPAPSKTVLIWVVVAALSVTAVLLALADRGVQRTSARRGRRWPRVVDVVVPAVLLLWTLIAPVTSDDGYFSTQARNAASTGEIGNYYQFFNASYAPFTWPYRALSWWQELAGQAPVVQRVPALVLGLVSWLLLRRVVAAATAQPVLAVRGMRVAAPVVLGAVFLAWWLPYNMGVRPEPVVACASAATLLAVLVAGRRRRLAVAWLACAVAGLGFTAHTTGFVLAAVLLAGLPLLWPLVRSPGAPAATALRALAVGSGGMVAPLVAFADNALRDFLRGQAMFLAVVPQDGWFEEIVRYQNLLDQDPMGSFARRAPVLACLVGLGWFAALAVAARMRRVPIPAAWWLSGLATALGFVAFWFTTSKWSHHFGALAGLGSAFLALALVATVPMLRRVLDGAGPPAGLVATVAGSFAVVLALSWHGPNDWPFIRLGALWAGDRPPSVGSVRLDSLLLWGLVILVAAAALALCGRWTGGQRHPRFAVLRAVPIVVVVSLVTTSGYVIGSFGWAAARGIPPGSVWAQGLADPAGAECGSTAALRVLDPRSAEPLPRAAGLARPPPPQGFTAGGGDDTSRARQGGYTANPPRSAAGARLWASLVGEPANRNSGRMTTGWYALPADLAGGAAVTVLAAGRLTGGNELTAVYGRRTGNTVVPVGAQQLVDSAPGPSWRTFVLAPAAGADLVRLRAVDATGSRYGWVRFSAPAASRPVALDEYLPDRAPVALGWQLGFIHHCLHQPRIVHGITEAPAYAVLLRGRAPGSGPATDGFDWQPDRGAVYGQVSRTQSVLRLATVGGNPRVEVYRFGTELSRDAYTVTVERRTVFGWVTAVRS